MWGRMVVLSRLEFFNCCPAFLKKDPVTAVGAADIDVDLNFLFAPSTLVRADHS